jgi:response regulator RpfG family c-di-GMP phosphodiesterase
MVRRSRATKQLVLVVDDNSLVRRALVRELSRDFNVITASNSSQARRILATQARIRVIISDCRMDGSHAGAELLEDASTKYPEIGRILVSGTFDQVQSQQLLDRGIVHAFFQKPWNRNELMSAITRFYSDFQPSHVIGG